MSCGIMEPKEEGCPVDYLAPLTRTAEYIEKHLNEKITLKDLAKVSGYSVYHLIRIFDAAIGETIGSYIRKRRLAVTAEALLNTEKRVLDIALESGFGSSEAFSRSFKSVYGLSPYAYRKRGEARYGELPWLRDALFAACRICAHLGMTGERLHGLAGKIPRFVLRRREVSLRSGQGEVLSVLLRTLPGAQPAGGGLRVRQGEGWVTLVPLARSAVLRIVGEARSAELAEELCAFCARRAEEADRGLPEK